MVISLKTVYTFPHYIDTALVIQPQHVFLLQFKFIICIFYRSHETRCQMTGNIYAFFVVLKPVTYCLKYIYDL